LRNVSLRYFNAAGADLNTRLGECHAPETHLIPLILEVANGRREHLTLFGDDYPTPDKTCIRDYIHVTDIAQAHLLALEKLVNNSPIAEAYNLGNGKGFSVREVIAVAEKVTGKKITIKIAARREGDPPHLVADSRKAIAELGWQTKHSDLATIIESAWRWELHRFPKT
jgi:UDP-glucose 4-epimerase